MTTTGLVPPQLHRPSVKENWATAPGTVRAAVVCFLTGGALLVIYAVMLLLGFGGSMRHLLTLASWLLPEEWGNWDTVAAYAAGLLRVIGAALAVAHLALGVLTCSVALPCLRGDTAGRWCATILTTGLFIFVTAGGVLPGLAVTAAVTGTVLLWLPESNRRFREARTQGAITGGFRR